MSNRIRSIQWFETRIISEIAKRKIITSYLALSSLVFSRGVRNLQEQHNYDIALSLLLSKKEITKEQDQDGFTIYKLAA